MRRQEWLPGKPLRKLTQSAVERLEITAQLLPRWRSSASGRTDNCRKTDSTVSAWRMASNGSSQVLKSMFPWLWAPCGPWLWVITSGNMIHWSLNPTAVSTSAFSGNEVVSTHFSKAAPFTRIRSAR